MLFIPYKQLKSRERGGRGWGFSSVVERLGPGFGPQFWKKKKKKKEGGGGERERRTKKEPPELCSVHIL